MSGVSIPIGAGPLSLEAVEAIARQGLEVRLDAALLPRIQRGADHLQARLDAGDTIYGVNTGYGDSGDRPVPPALQGALPGQLVRMHGCGLGADLSVAAARAVMVARLLSLAHGYSGVRGIVLTTLVACLNLGLTPRIPEEGSVGASGDLTPLSYVAAALMGERQLHFCGRWQPAGQALAAAQLAPLVLAPKEALALMNGTAFMTGLAVLAYTRADYLMRLSSRLTALTCWALGGSRGAYAPAHAAAKPHPGQLQVAAWLWQDLAGADAAVDAGRLQDRYALRCAPQVIGVLADVLPWLRRLIETELNSANDNPLIDPDTGDLLHGGHFYGGHIACAMDTLKTQVANLADLMDRQLAQLVDPHFNAGLPAGLSGASPETSSLNHGLKALQIAASAWTAEALKLTFPASAFSRSTECHNQDKVSMGNIAARDCLRILSLSEQVAVALLLACSQAVRLRQRQAAAPLPPALRPLALQVAARVPLLDQDRALEDELRLLLADLAARTWFLYPPTVTEFDHAAT